MISQFEKATAFKKLHEQTGAFVIPNPWDAGSARLFEALNFEALATTSSGFAYTLGRVDGMVTLEEKMAHCRALSAVTDIPISADLENCFAHDPRPAAETILLAAEAGVVGGSIEDYSGDAIYDFTLAVERVQAAVEAARSLDFPFTLTARAENLIRGRDDLDDSIRRLQAFEAAGADVLYAPGLKTLDEVRDVVSSVNKPVNVLVPFLRGVTVAELSEAGARRLSIGGAMASVIYGTLLEAGREMQESGSFAWLAKTSMGRDVGRLLG